MAKQKHEASEQYRAAHRFARVSARKARLVADLIRGAPAEKALLELKFCLKRAAPMVSKVLRSAMANATQEAGLEPSSLFVSRAVINEGPTLKRWRPRAMGRAYPRMKRTCHIEVSVSEIAEQRRATKKRSAADSKQPVGAPEDGGSADGASTRKPSKKSE